MPIITWEKTYNTGIEEIDDQHKKICDIINELHESITNEPFETTRNRAVQLVISSLEHMVSEEQYLEKHGYPDKEKHMEEHARFHRTGSGIQQAFEKDTKDLQLAIVAFLGDMFIKHILEQDMKYVTFFAAKGAK